MLNLTEASHFEEKISQLKALPEDGLYIVPDIQSKKRFQKYLKDEGQNPDCVLRLSDFFEELFKKTFPDWRLISKAQLAFLSQTHEWLAPPPPHEGLREILERPESAAQRQGRFAPSPATIEMALESYLPILAHKEGPSSYRQWLREKDLLFEWLEKFKESLDAQKWAPSSMMKYFLLDCDFKIKASSLTFDLGFFLDRTEAEIFYQISQKHELTLIRPQAFKDKPYPKAFDVYEFIQERAQKKAAQKTQKQTRKKHSEPFQTLSFKSPLDEVKYIVDQIKKALAEGAEPHQIAVAAPHIEKVWPCLKSFLIKENIPFEKGEKAALNSFPQIQKWMSLLYLKTGQISFEHLEQALLAEGRPFDQASLKQKYGLIQNIKDLNPKSAPLKHLMTEDLIKNQSLSLQDFLSYALKIWGEGAAPLSSNSKLDQALRKALQPLIEAFPSKKLYKKEDLLFLLEKILAETELTIREEKQEKGIVCLSLNALPGLKAERIFFMGLDENSLKSRSHFFMSESSAEKILRDLGFYCFPKDPLVKEYELFHFLQSTKSRVQLTYSETNWKGLKQSPSLIWLKGGSPPNLSIPPQPPPCLKGGAENMKLPINFPPIKELSPSKLKDYADCPFIFLAKHLFYLKDEEPKEITPSPLEKGRFIHRLFRYLLENNIKDEALISEWIKKESKRIIFFDKTRPHFEKFFLKTALRFLENEEKIKQLIPNIKTLKTESPFSFSLSPQALAFASLGEGGPNAAKTGRSILISGRLDRIDGIAEDSLLIIDYKGSLSKVKTAKHWPGSESSPPDFQMFFYIQSQKTKGTINSVYLSYKDFKMKGLVLQESPFRALPGLSPRSIQTNEKAKEILEKTRSHAAQYIQQIEKQNFKAAPLNKSTCKECSWRTICRAPHLH